ncbi:MAG: DUF4158 domain-containing protein [Isosphaeraceae bacterium]
MMPLSFSRGQMVREASLTEADLAEIAKCRRDQNRLGFAYQVGFVRLFSRFPAQQPLEVCDELLNFVAMQLNMEATQIDGYAARQHTVSDHQASIRGYLKLAVFDADQAQALERFVFEESSRLEQRPSCSPGPASSSKNGACCSPPTPRCCGWSASREGRRASASSASWPGAFRPAWSRPSTACWR